MNKAQFNCMPVLPDEIILRLDAASPSYASYPTADRFVEAFAAEQVSQALAQRQHGAAAMVLPLSIYVHIPFCESLCHYCARNKIVTTHHAPCAWPDLPALPEPGGGPAHAPSGFGSADWPSAPGGRVADFSERR